MDELIRDFLAQKRIAVVGVARSGQDTATFILAKLRQQGYDAVGVNPHGGTSGGAPVFASVKDIPGGVDGAVLVTRPEVALAVVRDCHAAGIPRVWMHDNTLLPGSSSLEAVAFCVEHGIKVIPRGCPMMHVKPDPAHRFLGWVLRAVGRLPG